MTAMRAVVLAAIVATIRVTRPSSALVLTDALAAAVVAVLPTATGAARAETGAA